MRSSTSSSDPHVPTGPPRAHGWRRLPIAATVAAVAWFVVDRSVTYERIKAWREETHAPWAVNHLEIVADFERRRAAPRQPGRLAVHFVGDSRTFDAFTMVFARRNFRGRPVDARVFAAWFHDAQRQWFIQPEIEDPAPDIVVMVVGELNLCRPVRQLTGKYLRVGADTLREHLLYVPQDVCVKEIPDYEELVLDSLSNIYRNRTLLLWRFDDYPEWVARRVPKSRPPEKRGRPQPDEPSLVRVLAAATLRSVARTLGSSYDRTLSPEERRLLALGPIPPRTEEAMAARNRGLRALRAGPHRHTAMAEWAFAGACLRHLEESEIRARAVRTIESAIRRWKARGTDVVVVRGFVDPRFRALMPPAIVERVDRFLPAFCARLDVDLLTLRPRRFAPDAWRDPIHMRTDSADAARITDEVLERCFRRHDARAAGARAP